MARIVVALGGNALQKKGETDVFSQKSVARETARQLAGLIEGGHQVVIVHGNGPQVGAIMLHENQPGEPPVPLDVCVAMSQGEIGYWLQQALVNEFRIRGITIPVATIATQVVVSADDPSFSDPSKPIGAFYPDERTAREVTKGDGFVFKEDAGRGWRRVVPSPRPVDVVESEFIKHAVDAGHVVIAAGGGGIPVKESNGELVGVEAVIDKDFAAEKVAELVGADMLVILTAVDAVTINFRQPDEQPLGMITPEDVETYIARGEFAPGSMLPKMQAILKFVQSNRSHTAIVTSPDKLEEALSGKVGTHVQLA